MKKIVCALVVLALAAPASADVIITCEQVVDELSTIISYECTGGDVVRCFGLDIQLDNDETITAVECLSSDYYLNPQKFTYDGINPDFGTTPCLCNADDGLLPGLDSNGVTISMCSLYSTPPQNDPDHNAPPATSNGLVKLTLSGAACITITENGTLGGVLKEDNNPPAVLTLPGTGECCVESIGCACPGDYNGDTFVMFSDVSDLVNTLIAHSWFIMEGGAGWDVCGDFNEDTFMMFSDVSDLVNYLIANSWFVMCP